MAGIFRDSAVSAAHTWVHSSLPQDRWARRKARVKAPGPSGSCLLFSRISAACSSSICSARPKMSACLLGKWWRRPPLLTDARAATSSRVSDWKPLPAINFSAARRIASFVRAVAVAWGATVYILTYRLDGFQKKETGDCVFDHCQRCKVMGNFGCILACLSWLGSWLSLS